MLAACGCNSHAPHTDSAHEKPAKVEKMPVETELAVVTLSSDAIRRLGIETAPVVQQQVSQRRTLGGEAVVPTGRSIIVSAPLSGIVTRPLKQAIPLPGARVAQGEQLLTLVPLLSPERDVLTPAEQVQLVGARANLVAARTVAQGDVDRSRAEVEAAKIALDRSEQLFKDRAGPRRAVDDATAQMNIAQSVLDAAQQRESQLADLLKLLEQPTGGSGNAIALPLATPISGIVNRLSISEGQTVASGTALFEVVNLDTIWIRVPVFVDILPSIDKARNARLVPLSGGRLAPQLEARESDMIEAVPVAAPPTADTLSSSADLYYQVDNRQLGLRPGQCVGV